MPVYEIYKAGQPARWLQGLDIMGTLLGLRVAIVPHWNNAEGATHDTSRCFIGDAKLRELERSLAPGIAILGIDEHTALTIDFATDLVTVHGKGAVTIRIPGGGETALHSGASEPIGVFGARVPRAGSAQPRARDAALDAESTVEASDRSVHDVPVAASARDLLAPAVERLIALRATARAEKRFADADAIRRAYAFAEQHHRDQLRHSGEPYITHPLGCARICAELGLDGETIQAAASSPDLDLPIEDLDLSERPRNCLKRARVDTIGQLVMKTEDDLLAITNFGQKSLDEVLVKLDERGLALRIKD